MSILFSKRTFLLIGVSFVVLLIAALWYAPTFCKNYFNKHAKDLTGRNGHLEKLEFNYFTCAATLHDFSWYERDDTTSFVHFNQLYVNVHFWNMLIGRWLIEELTLQSPSVRIINTGKGFNFDDLLQSDDTTSTESDSSKIEFEVLNFKLRSGKIVYLDQPVNNKIWLDSISFDIPQFKWSNESSDMDIAFEINKVGSIAMDSEYNPIAQTFDCSLQLRKIDLAIIRPYLLSMYPKMKDFKGWANGGVELHSGFGEKNTALIIHGDTWLTDVEMRDSSYLPMARVDSAYLKLDEFDYYKNRYVFSKAYVDQLFFRYDQMTTTSNVEEVFELNTPVDTARYQLPDSLFTENTLYYALDTILLNNSKILYRDYQMNRPFYYELSGVVGRAENFTSTSKENRISSQGILNSKGNYTANLISDPNDPMNFTIDFVLNGLQISDFSPYGEFYAGHELFKGEVVYKGYTKVHKGLMDSRNSIRIYDMKVGDKVAKKPLYAIPLKFAVFLLKDKNGIVNINLPMHGDVNDPEFRVGPLIWQVIKQNLEKIVAGPQDILAKQFGLDAARLNYIPFDIGDTTLNKEAIVNVQTLADLLQKKEGLAVQLQYYQPDLKELLYWKKEEAKIQYSIEQQKANSRTEGLLMSKRIDDYNYGFVQYLQTKTGNTSSQTDSLAHQFISLEQVQAVQDRVQQARIRAIQHYIQGREPALLQRLSYPTTTTIPETKVVQPVFLLKMEMTE